MIRKNPLLPLLLVLAGCGLSHGAVTIAPGPPGGGEGAIMPIGGSFDAGGIGHVTGGSGAAISFGIFYSAYGYGVTADQALTETYLVTTARDFELPLGALLTLAAGDYWLVAFATVPASSPGVTAAMGFLAMPFKMEEATTISAIGVADAEGESTVYLRVIAVPEPSSMMLVAGAGVLLGRRKRR